MIDWEKFRKGWVPVIVTLAMVASFSFTMGKNHRLPQPYYNLISCSKDYQDGEPVRFDAVLRSRRE